MVGVGGIGTGLFFALDGNRTLGRNESRAGRLLNCRDYCKLHIIMHFAGVTLGARPSGRPFHLVPIGKVGDDAAGLCLRKEMQAAGMDTRFVDVVSSRPTMLSICVQYPDGSGGNITASHAASGLLAVRDIARARPLLAADGSSTIALAAPEVPLPVRLRLLEIATQYGAFRAASIASAEVHAARLAGFFERVDLLAINEDEAMAISGATHNPRRPQHLLDACAAVLLRANPRMQIVVSMGRSGAYAFDGARWAHAPAIPVKVASSAGAGDALFGGILAGLAAGLPLLPPAAAAHRSAQDKRHPSHNSAGRLSANALHLGLLLATLNVTSIHTIHPGVSRRTLPRLARQLGITLEKPLREFLAS